MKLLCVGLVLLAAVIGVPALAQETGEGQATKEAMPVGTATTPKTKTIPEAPPKEEWCGPGKSCDCWLNEAWAKGWSGHAWAHGKGWRKNPCLTPASPSPNPGPRTRGRAARESRPRTA